MISIRANSLPPPFARSPNRMCQWHIGNRAKGVHFQYRLFNHNDANFFVLPVIYKILVFLGHALKSNIIFTKLLKTPSQKFTNTSGNVFRKFKYVKTNYLQYKSPVCHKPWHTVFTVSLNDSFKLFYISFSVNYVTLNK